MFDTDRFVADCQAALHSADPAGRIATVLTEALRDPRAVAAALAADADTPGLVPLFRSDALTVAHVVSAPHSRSPIHNHCMWGVIGIYAGQEDNHLYRRGDGGLHVYGGDLLQRPGRSLWDPDSGAEEPYAFERVLEYTARLSAA